MNGGDSGARTIFLVRHAVAKGRSGWKGPDELRPLTKKGERQAKGLVRILDGPGSRVGRILASPTLRCVDTVAPAAAKLGLEVERADELLEGTPVSKAYDLILELAGRDYDSVVCTHGDVVIELLDLMHRDRVQPKGGQRWSKGSTWELTVHEGRLHRARYLPPPKD